MEDSARNSLSPVDYVIFSSMLMVSLLIGIYYAYRDKKAKNGTEGYLMGNREMGTIPVAFSLAVSFQSSVTILGIPADAYFYGVCYIWTMVGLAMACLVTTFVFLPTLYNLRITSVYEYLERRFSRVVRLTNSISFILQQLLYVGINIYAPALALSGVTGFDLHTAMLSTALVCIFYTALGGLRGVVWSDVFQGVMMLIGLLSVVIQGSLKVGGFQKVWRLGSLGGRTNVLEFDLDPRVRYTFWTGVMGGFILWLGIFGTGQAQIQRLSSVKSRSDSIKAMWLGCIGVILVTSMSVLCGVVMYAYYFECDPLSAKCVRMRDEILPYAVMELFRDNIGLPGIFLSCVFSASLSTVSSGINAMVAVAVKDFVKPYTNWTHVQYTRASQGFGLLFGLISLAVSYLASVVESIVSLSIACSSALLGPSLAMFLLGIWFPFANSLGTLIGYVTGLVVGVTMFIGNNMTPLPAHVDRKLEVSTRHCPANCSFVDAANITLLDYHEAANGFNSTQNLVNNHVQLEGLQNFYALSYLYTGPVGFTCTLLVGIVFSLLTCGWSRRHEVDKSLVRPPFELKMFSWIPERIRSYLRCGISWSTSQDAGDNADHKETEQLTDDNGRSKQTNM